MSIETKAAPTPHTVADADWTAMRLLGSTAFGAAEPPEAMAAWQSQVPPDAAVVIEDAGDIVGQSMYLDLELTVPGGQVLPTAGVTWVAVAPTHRRRGLLRSMYTELHRRIAAAGYPMAALTASEGGIYGRFGYGPATVDREITIDRRFARFHPDAPDPGGVRMVTLAEHRGAFEAVYERWRQVTPGGLVRWRGLWDEVFADREDGRRGASAWYAFLHADGYALYRVHGFDPKTVRVEEMTAVTPDARVALWRALCGLDLVERIVVGSHQDEMLPYLLSDPRLARTTGFADALWLRIMNVPAALEARTYLADVSAVLQVGDGFRDDGGTFAFEVRDGRARCTRTDAPADIRLDLDVLGSLYLGAHRASAFAHANRLRCNDSGLLRRLEQAFAGEVPAVLGFGF